MPPVRTRKRGRPAGGSVEVVAAIVDTTLAQLGAVGYAALSIDDIARAAKVNKSTIYRRWPTKADLVIAAVVANPDHGGQLEPSGRLRDDLVALLRDKARCVSSPRQRAITLAISALDSSVKAALLQELRRRRYTMPVDVIERAIARGELPDDTNASLLAELLIAPLFYRALVLREPVSRQVIEKTVDVILGGAGYRAIKRH